MLVLVCMETNTPAAPGNLTFTWLFDGDLEDDQVILDGGGGACLCHDHDRGHSVQCHERIHPQQRREGDWLHGGRWWHVAV